MHIVPGGYARQPGAGRGAVINKQSRAAGILEFQYQVAGINLKSILMTWYTVSANRAMFQGEATINGGGLFTFRAQAIDGDQSGREDHFDIVYDHYPELSVLRGDGSLGGYRWGTERKRALIEAERKRSRRAMDPGSSPG